MKIVWTDPAVEDLRNLREFIARDSETYAAHFVARILVEVDRLETLPESGRWVPEVSERTDIRELLVSAYRVVYQVESDRVSILAVLHGRRDLTQMERITKD